MTLAIVWYAALAVVWVGFFLLEGFDFGVGMLHTLVGRDEDGRATAIGTIAPVWDGNEVWLIVAVAGTFAAFPGWYATMFSAFYPLFLIVLLALILRGVSFEFRAHASGPRGRRLWSGAMGVGSALVPLFLGIALGDLLHGVPLDARGDFVGSFGDLFAPYAVYTGITVTLLCLLHGAVFLALRTGGDVHRRAARIARVLGPPTAVVVTAFAFWTRFGSLHGVLLTVAEFVAVLAAIAAAGLTRTGRQGAAFAATSLTMAAVVASIFTELYPRVMVSTLGPASDLTVAGTASSSYALGLMTIVLVIFLPAILIYQAWTYYVFRRRLGLTGPPPGGGGRRPGAAPSAPAVARQPRPEASSARRGPDAAPLDTRSRLSVLLLAALAAFVVRRLRAASHV